MLPVSGQDNLLYLILACNKLLKHHLLQDTQASCQSFDKQVGKFSDMADLICSMTDDEEGKRMVRMSFKQLDDLKTKLENAVLVLAQIPDSKAALENVNVFKKAWVDQVKTFMDAVDDIISVRDFLSVVENHILEDVKICCKAMQVCNRSGNLCVHGSFRPTTPGQWLITPEQFTSEQVNSSHWA